MLKTTSAHETRKTLSLNAILQLLFSNLSKGQVISMGMRPRPTSWNYMVAAQRLPRLSSLLDRLPVFGNHLKLSVDLQILHKLPIIAPTVTGIGGVARAFLHPLARHGLWVC